jgi:hypothetical protein
MQFLGIAMHECCRLVRRGMELRCIPINLTGHCNRIASHRKGGPERVTRVSFGYSLRLSLQNVKVKLFYYVKFPVSQYHVSGFGVPKTTLLRLSVRHILSIKLIRVRNKVSAYENSLQAQFYKFSA